MRVPETPSTRHGGGARARETARHAANNDDKEPRRHGSARTGRPPEAEMGTPVLLGAGRKGNQRPALVRAAVDLGLYPLGASRYLPYLDGEVVDPESEEITYLRRFLKRR